MDRVEDNKHEVTTNISREEQRSDSDKREPVVNSEDRTEPVVKSEDIAPCGDFQMENEDKPQENAPIVEPMQEEAQNKFSNEPEGNDSVLEDDVCEEKKKILKELTQNCLGILFSLRNGGDFNIRDNRFIKHLGNTIFDTNEAEFHEINNVLLGLSGRKIEL